MKQGRLVSNLDMNRSTKTLSIENINNTVKKNRK